VVEGCGLEKKVPRSIGGFFFPVEVVVVVEKKAFFGVHQSPGISNRTREEKRTV
jgi:hypothetical protein